MTVIVHTIIFIEVIYSKSRVLQHYITSTTILLAGDITHHSDDNGFTMYLNIECFHHPSPDENACGLASFHFFYSCHSELFSLNEHFLQSASFKYTHICIGEKVDALTDNWSMYASLC